MGEHLERTVRALEERFGATSSEFRGEITVFLQPHQIVEACTMLRDEFDFEMLEDETAVDYWPEETPRFHVVYHIYSYRHNERIRLRVPLNGNNPSIPTIEGVYPNANWYEREVYDMFGIHYEGHSDLRRILMPHDWEGHPLRKDYPLGHEEIMFTFNFDEINSRKRYATE